MLSVGDLVRVHIREIGFGGEGVARSKDGAVMFVPFTAVGDCLVAEVTEVRKNFYRGKVRRLEEPGPDRVEPVCEHFGQCGGCAYQHLNYGAELAAKRTQFGTVMQRIGKFEQFPELECFAPSSERFGYRNKLRLEPIPEGDRQHCHYGFCERDNTTFFPVASCPLADARINENIRTFQRGQWAMDNVRRPKPYPLTYRVDSTGKVVAYFGHASPNLTWLHERLADQEVLVPVGSFWQVNPPVASLLIARLRDWLAQSGGRALVDAYGGIGTFSLALGDLFQYRVIIESDEQAVTASKFNHSALGLKASFIAGTTESSLEKALVRTKAEETVVILDPPRTGCDPKVIRTLAEFQPATVAYVSCNVSTLARDLRLLCENGLYAPVRAAAFDMFPATAHFESLVLLQKR
ncbi:MAG: class I SAM-dependent RNA methyltransferase [Victivallales bacterium]|nr:class I SAM-dependent RNA methyltransferase [Victivallales bacterium]